MKLICRLTDLFEKSIPNPILREDVNQKLNHIFLTVSDCVYGWKTERINTEPAAVKFIAANWNNNIKQDFLRLISDPAQLETMETNSSKAKEIAYAANALANIHDFCGFWHVLETDDSGKTYNFETLIHPFTQTRIIAHPENYILVIGETRFMY